MNRQWRGVLASLITAFAFSVPALGAEVSLNKTLLPADQGWVENGTSYITLRALAQHTGYQLTWDGQKAILQGEDLLLEAAPGALYISSNQRALYVPARVQVVEGKTALPLRVVAEALGGELTWDGSTAHWSFSQTAPARASYPEEDLYWLARVISAESRGESLRGQIAVGNVVLNRVADSQFPNTIKGVVFDRKNGVQFEPVSNGTIYNEPTQQSLLAAKLCLEGVTVVGDCLYFYAPALSSGTWIANNRTYYTTIGCHKFYL